MEGSSSARSRRSLHNVRINDDIRQVLMGPDWALDVYPDSNSEENIRLQKQSFKYICDTGFDDWMNYVIGRRDEILTPRELAGRLIFEFSVDHGIIKDALAIGAVEVFCHAGPPLLKFRHSVDNDVNRWGLLDNECRWASKVFEERMDSSHRLLEERDRAQKTKKRKRRSNSVNFHGANLQTFEETAEQCTHVNRRILSLQLINAKIENLKSVVTPKATTKRVHGVAGHHWIYIGLAEGIGQFLDAWCQCFQFSLILVYGINQDSSLF